MKGRDPTVADWIAEGMATIALHCGCGRYATVKLSDLPPAMRRSRLGRNARCAACGKRGAQVMRDMDSHYEAMEATGWSCEPKPWPGVAHEKSPEAEAPGRCVDGCG